MYYLYLRAFTMSVFAYIVCIQNISLWVCVYCIILYFIYQESELAYLKHYLWACLIPKMVIYVVILRFTDSRCLMSQGKEGEAHVIVNVICDKRGTTDPVSTTWLPQHHLTFPLPLCSLTTTWFSHHYMAPPLPSGPFTIWLPQYPLVFLPPPGSLNTTWLLYHYLASSPRNCLCHHHHAHPVFGLVLSGVNY